MGVTIRIHQNTGGGGGAVDSFNGRTGLVVSQNGDYNSTQVTNNSTITGTTVTDALNNLEAGIPAWEQKNDTQYTTSSRFNVIGGAAAVVLPNNGLSVINTYMPSGITFYDGTTQKITPQSIGEVYSLRISFKGESAVNQNYLTLGIDIGDGSPIIIFERNITFPRGAGVEHSFTSSNLIYALGTFIANGGQIKIFADSSAEIWDVSYVIARSTAADLDLPDAPSDGNDYVRNNGSWVQASAGGLTKTTAVSTNSINSGLDLSGNTYYGTTVTLPGIVVGDVPQVGVSQELMDAALSGGTRLAETLFVVTGNDTVVVYVNVSSFITGSTDFKVYAEITK